MSNFRTKTLLFLLFLEYIESATLTNEDDMYKKFNTTMDTVKKMCKVRSNFCKDKIETVCTMRILDDKIQFRDYNNTCHLFLSNVCDQPGKEFKIIWHGACETYTPMTRRKTAQIDSNDDDNGVNDDNDDDDSDEKEASGQRSDDEEAEAQEIEEEEIEVEDSEPIENNQNTEEKIKYDREIEDILFKIKSGKKKVTGSGEDSRKHTKFVKKVKLPARIAKVKKVSEKGVSNIKKVVKKRSKIVARKLENLGPKIQIKTSKAPGTGKRQTKGLKPKLITKESHTTKSNAKNLRSTTLSESGDEIKNDSNREDKVDEEINDSIANKDITEIKEEEEPVGKSEEEEEKSEQQIFDINESDAVEVNEADKEATLEIMNVEMEEGYAIDEEEVADDDRAQKNKREKDYEDQVEKRKWEARKSLKLHSNISKSIKNPKKCKTTIRNKKTVKNTHPKAARAVKKFQKPSFKKSARITFPKKSKGEEYDDSDIEVVAIRRRFLDHRIMRPLRRISRITDLHRLDNPVYRTRGSKEKVHRYMKSKDSTESIQENTKERLDTGKINSKLDKISKTIAALQKNVNAHVAVETKEKETEKKENLLRNKIVGDANVKVCVDLDNVNLKKHIGSNEESLNKQKSKQIAREGNLHGDDKNYSYDTEYKQKLLKLIKETMDIERELVKKGRKSSKVLDNLEILQGNQMDGEIMTFNNTFKPEISLLEGITQVLLDSHWTEKVGTTVDYRKLRENKTHVKSETDTLKEIMGSDNSDSDSSLEKIIQRRNFLANFLIDKTNEIEEKGFLSKLELNLLNETGSNSTEISENNFKTYQISIDKLSKTNSSLFEFEIEAINGTTNETATQTYDASFDIIILPSNNTISSSEFRSESNNTSLNESINKRKNDMKKIHEVIDSMIQQVNDFYGIPNRTETSLSPPMETNVTI